MKNQNLKSLQILRGLAAISVVYFHIGASPNFGRFGVDIFFVISGFVMAMIVANGQSSFTFAINRITRIIPLYWVLTTGVFILAAIKPELLNSTTANLTNYAKSLFFVPYFKENGELHPMLAVGWTLNYEMFFYLCIYLSIVVIRKYYALLTIGTIVVLYILSFKTDNEVVKEFFGNTVLFEFVFGILAFKIHQWIFTKNINAGIYALLTVASFLFMAIIDSSNVEINRALLFGMPSLLLVVSFVNLENAILNSRVNVSVLTKIGDESYATYLSHFFVVLGMRKIVIEKLHWLDPNSPFRVIIIVGLCLFVGHLLYVIIDYPLSTLCKKQLRTFFTPFIKKE